MKPLMIKPMIHAARRAIARGTGSEAGNIVFVGWDGKAISGGMDIRQTLPHEKLVIPPGMTVEELTVEMTLAANRLRKVMPKALESYDPVKASRDASRRTEAGFGIFGAFRSRKR